MSGHSHAKKIKHQKAVTDQKRGKIFSKISRMISVAVQDKGQNPNINYALKTAIEKAREVNMPQENIDRAIKRGTGELSGEKLEEIVFEAYGPAGIAIIIEGITDNKNRTSSEIKQVLNQNGGKMVENGSVKWLFERKGCLSLDLSLQNENFKNKEILEMLAIEAGAEDFIWDDNLLVLYTGIDNLDKIKKDLEEKGAKIESTSLDWVAKEEMQVDEKIKEVCQKLFNSLDELDSVQEVYSNLKE
jgi:YebC/PmpR family DNA-binding regulatory protein